ncbi:MAG: hybrid sensor histidine kinase/response regulator, partial [Gammaproteobacteria bacterium]
MGLLSAIAMHGASGYNSEVERCIAGHGCPVTRILTVKKGGRKMSVAKELLNVGLLDTRVVLNALTAAKNGDFSVRLPVDWTGVNGKIADTFNEVVSQNERITKELERVSRAVGREGKLGQRAALGNGAGGAWAQEIAAVNALIDGLVWPIGETARILGGVAKGDLAQTMTLETDGQPLKGEFLRMAKTVNAMVEQLNAFAAEVTRVAREVGT